MATKTKLERLTDEQEAQIAPWRDQWIAHGLNTEPAHRPRAEAGVRLAYQAAGLEPPHIFIWLDSPLAGCYGAAMLANLPKGAQVRAQVGDQVWAQVRDQVWAQVRDQVWAQVRDQVRAQVRDQVRAQVGAQVWAQVWAQVGAQVGAQVWAQVGDQVGDQVWDQVHKSAWGQHDAWLSFHDFMHRVVAVPGAERIEGLTEVAQSAGWWWPFKGAVILTERPTALHRDAENRLHNEDGPALSYPDGWSIWAWHGVRVPQWAIEAPTAELIHAEGNVEIRRCAIERLGWDAYIRQADLQLSDPVADPGNPGQELRLSQPLDLFGGDEELVRVLICTNGTVERDGTRRSFGLTVPAVVTTPIAAAAWGYDLTPKQYAQLARRT